MMYVLDKLWRGKLSPSEQCVNADSEYSRLRRSLIQKGKELNAALSEDGKRLFEEYQEIQMQMCSISEEDVFVNAFRIGVGMILDATGTYESQFVRYHED